MKEMEKVLKKNAHLLERRAREQVFGRSVLELLDGQEFRFPAVILLLQTGLLHRSAVTLDLEVFHLFSAVFKYMNQTPSQFRCSMKSK